MIYNINISEHDSFSRGEKMNTSVPMGNSIPASVIKNLIRSLNLQSVHALYDYILKNQAGYVINTMEVRHKNMDCSYVSIAPTICSILHEKRKIVLNTSIEDQYKLLETTKRSLSENPNFSLVRDILIDSGIITKITAGYQPHSESADDRFIPQVVIYST